MDIEGLFNLGIPFNDEADLTWESNVATNVGESGSEKLTSPGFDDRAFFSLESVNPFTCCSQLMHKFKNEEHIHRKVMRGLPLVSSGFM